MMSGSDANAGGGTPDFPMSGPYLIRNPSLVRTLTVADGLSRVLAGGKKRNVSNPPVSRLLLAMGGHLGDTVIASSVLPDIRRAWPEVEIGVLLGSWSRVVLEGHTDVRWIHTMDHWKLNRGGEKGRWQRLRHHVNTRQRALHEIRSVGYDLAIDLYPYFPNAIPLLHQARIPRRVGYRSGGFGPLLTDALDWRETPQHMADQQRELLRTVGIDPGPEPPRYSLPTEQLGASLPKGDDFRRVVVHMGSGLALKEWPRKGWAEVVDGLLAEGCHVVLTGQGGAHARETAALALGRENCTDLCNRLDWTGFVRTIRDADLVVSIDSVAAHIAGGMGTPAVVLMSGMNRIEQWLPLGEGIRMVTHSVPCAPCHRSRGCESMACVRGISPEAVLAQVKNLTDPQTEPSSGVQEKSPTAPARFL